MKRSQRIRRGELVVTYDEPRGSRAMCLARCRATLKTSLACLVKYAYRDKWPQWDSGPTRATEEVISNA